MKIVNSCIRTNKLPKNIPKGKEPNSCSSKAIYGMAALQGHCQRLFSALNTVSLYLSYRERKDCALSPIKVSREKICESPDHLSDLLLNMEINNLARVLTG